LNIEWERKVVRSDDTESCGEVSAAAETGGESGRFRHLFESLQDAVAEIEIVDGTPVVREVNESFVSVFGYGREELRGESLNEFIVPETLAGEATDFDNRTGEGEHNKAVVRRETDSGIRRFLYRGVPYEDATGTPRGFAIYSDITDETRREHRLQVMHRILRHNLRNEVTAIDAGAEWLETELDDERLVESISQIRGAAENLAHLSEEAGRVKRVLDTRTDSQQDVAVGPLFESLGTEYRRQYPEARLEIDPPESLTVRATEHLERALSELIENAVEHNDTDDPVVSVTTDVPASSDSGWVQLVVADNGPEIPPSERRVTSTGREPTQIEHGSGLGLLLVGWIVDSAGGAVTIDDSALGGNRVELRLKRAVE
jgi:PAS domain S-box-containing protein